MKLNISYPHEIDELTAKIRDEINKVIKSSPAIVEYKVRSAEKNYKDKQMAALHVWCQEMAKQLNDAGLYRVCMSAIGKTFSPDMFSQYTDVVSLKEAIDEYFLKNFIVKPWSKMSVKEEIWKPILEAETGKTSTNEQSTTDPNTILNVIRVHFWEAKQFTLPEWPSLR